MPVIASILGHPSATKAMQVDVALHLSVQVSAVDIKAWVAVFIEYDLSGGLPYQYSIVSDSVCEPASSKLQAAYHMDAGPDSTPISWR